MNKNIYNWLHPTYYGGKIINFPGDIATSTVDITTFKLMFTSLISIKNLKIICADIANFYLNNTMDIYEYMKLALQMI